MRYLILVPVLLLSACTTPINCPPLVQYTELEQKVGADELIKAGPQTQIFVVDYVKLRQACRDK